MSKSILNIDYRETLDVVDSYEEYLSSMNITLDAQLWKKSLSIDNKRVYQKYLNKYPKGHYYDEAQLKINAFNAIEEREEEAKAWSKALNKNTKASYEKYLTSNYNGLHSNEAKIKVDEFIQLEKEKKLEEQRLRNIELAKERIRLEKIEQEKKLALDKEKVAWELVCKKNTIEDYENYLKFYPTGIYLSEATDEIERIKVKRIQQDEENESIAWSKARREDNYLSYSKYLKNYPHGKTKKEAETLCEMMKSELNHLKLKKRLFIHKLGRDIFYIQDREKNQVCGFYEDIQYIKKHGLIQSEHNKGFSILSEYDKPINLLDINVIQVQKNSLYGLISANAEKKVLECKYPQQIYFDFNFLNENIANVASTGNSVLAIIIPFSLEIINTSFMSIFRDDIVKIQTHGGWHYEGYRNNCFGILDKNGNLLLEPIYESICLLKNGLGMTETLDGKKGLINSQYEVILEPKYEYISIDSPGDIVQVHDVHGQVGLVNSRGEIIYPISAYYISYTKSKNLFLVCNSKESYELINNKGERLLENSFIMIKEVANDRFKIKNHNGKYGIINHKGEYIFELEYDDIEAYKGFIRFHKYFSIGLSDYNGNIILKREWANITISDEFILFTKSKQTGVMNHQRKILLKHGKYWESSIHIRKHPKNGKEILEYGTLMKTGVIDSNGNDVIPLMNNFKYNLVQTKFFKEIW